MYTPHFSGAHTTMKSDQGTMDDKDLKGPSDLGDSSKNGSQKHDEGDQNHSPLSANTRKCSSHSAKND